MTASSYNGGGGKDRDESPMRKSIGKGVVGFAAAAATLAAVCCSEPPPASAESLTVAFPVSRAREVAALFLFFLLIVICYVLVRFNFGLSRCL